MTERKCDFMNEILNCEPDFTESKFKTYVDNMFIQIHLAVMTKELEKIKHFVSGDVYHKLEEKIASLEERKVVQMYDEINVKQTTILSGIVQDEKMVIKVNITSRYMDYLMDEDGNVVSGISDHRIEKENYLTFEKKIHHLTSGQARKCPGCGANIDVNANGKCAYCGTTYNLEDKDWVLTSLETV